MEVTQQEKRPEIPEEIKRKVRKDCFFGCVICGMPFFQYDHIDEYSEVKEHSAENLALLCPNHHAAKTTNKLSKERVRAGKLHPYNASRTHSTALKIEPSEKLIVKLGSNAVSGLNYDENGTHYPIWINGQVFFSMHKEAGWLTFSLFLTDADGNVLLKVHRGELVVFMDNWDYVYEGDNIKIRAGLRNILLDLNLSDSKIEMIKGWFLDSNKDGFSVEGGTLSSFIDGIPTGSFSNNAYTSNGFGGFGLLNTEKHPEIIRPRGFPFVVEW